jgi:peptidoglycan hydrolase-like protein with peptidoglycan-binding domain
VSRNLRTGSEGEDVRSLQRFLNCTGFTLTEEGAGAPGQETTVFSNRTYNALNKFQEYHASHILTPLGLTKGTGIFGELSRKRALELGG